MPGKGIVSDAILYVGLGFLTFLFLFLAFAIFYPQARYGLLSQCWANFASDAKAIGVLKQGDLRVGDCVAGVVFTNTLSQWHDAECKLGGSYIIGVPSYGRTVQQGQNLREFWDSIGDIRLNIKQTAEEKVGKVSGPDPLCVSFDQRFTAIPNIIPQPDAPKTYCVKLGKGEKAYNVNYQEKPCNDLPDFHVPGETRVI